MLAGLAHLVDEATGAFDASTTPGRLERTETWFWSFCDDYLELVKGRAYGDGRRRRSAAAALGLALEALLKLFAPFLPYATEEVWSWWQDGRAIHRSAWPDAAPLRAAPAMPTAAAAGRGRVLAEIRKAKSEAKRSMRTPVAPGRGHRHRRAPGRARARADDLKAAGVIGDLATEVGDAFSVDRRPRSRRSRRQAVLVGQRVEVVASLAVPGHAHPRGALRGSGSPRPPRRAPLDAGCAARGHGELLGRLASSPPAGW